VEHLTYEIYAFVQRGLFERHKIIFALMLALSVLESAGKVRRSSETLYYHDCYTLFQAKIFRGSGALLQHLISGSLKYDVIVARQSWRYRVDVSCIRVASFIEHMCTRDDHAESNSG
jgi:hypothetical protein